MGRTGRIVLVVVRLCLFFFTMLVHMYRTDCSVLIERKCVVVLSEKRAVHSSHSILVIVRLSLFIFKMLGT